MSHYEPLPLAANELWIPGQNYSIDAEYPTPSNEELADLWHDYTGPDATVLATPGIFGAMRVPDAPPTSYVSVDACEVIRATNLGIIAAQRSAEHLLKSPVQSIHCYGEGCTYEEDYADIQTLAQVLIEGDLVEPVDGIEQMTETMQRWRQLGAYTILNTSTLPGCEPGTIRFLARYMPGAFDALLLPRNHNSDASLATKGDVAADLTLTVEQMGFRDKTRGTCLERDIPAVHIDDKPCHNVAFREAMHSIGASVYTVQPMYPSHHEADPQSIQTETPLGAFHAADLILSHEMADFTRS